jgi:hypothetical protein
MVEKPTDNYDSAFERMQIARGLLPGGRQVMEVEENVVRRRAK